MLQTDGTAVQRLQIVPANAVADFQLGVGVLRPAFASEVNDHQRNAKFLSKLSQQYSKAQVSDIILRSTKKLSCVLQNDCFLQNLSGQHRPAASNNTTRVASSYRSLCSRACDYR